MQEGFMNLAIRVENLTMLYGGRLAVDRISLEVGSDEVFGLLGPNGAGKTTTQRILAGVLPPTGGIVHVLDHDMVKNPIGAKQHIGVVPELANPYMELSGWQNLIFMGELYGLNSRVRRERAESLLRDLKLWERRNDLAKRYSKGMRQRLVFAMAMLHGPRILFLDEPTAGLDVESRRMILQTVRRLASQGVTIFYTTHNIEEANVLCTRVAIIREGRLVAMDRPEILKSTFMGSQSVVVAFRGVVNIEPIMKLEGAGRVESQGDKVVIYTSSPGEMVTQVVNFARDQQLEILSVNTHGPSLEEVFLSLAGDGESVRRSSEA
jgi:ABC-2 type transport system ATP-binding protein